MIFAGRAGINSDLADDYLCGKAAAFAVPDFEAAAHLFHEA